MWELHYLDNFCDRLPKVQVSKYFLRCVVYLGPPLNDRFLPIIPRNAVVMIAIILALHFLQEIFIVRNDLEALLEKLISMLN